VGVAVSVLVATAQDIAPFGEDACAYHGRKSNIS
jgi:hypothetical protein